MAKNAEITTEANPNSASKYWLEQMKELGVNRVSFGVQSFDKDKLKYLGRNHSEEDAKNAIKNAYKAGIKNISLDLIHGCEHDNKKLLQNDLDIAFSLPINHISSYSLTIEKNTKFYKNNVKNKEVISEQKWFYNQIIKNGFTQYEISNFGKYRSIHNLGYWKHKDYIGIGAGAVGFLKNKRFYPHKNIEKYIKDPIFFNIENLNEKDLKMEKIFLGLRSIVGFNIDILNKNELKKIEILLDEGKIRHKNNIIFNNDYLLSDEIVLFILS
jgi:oxygen-independent coproporphyrinogen-3 oxidase